MVGHRLDAHAGSAQLNDVGGQPIGDPLGRIHEVQLLDSHTTAVVAPDLAIIDVQHHLVAAEVQIPHELASARVHGPGRTTTGVAHCPKPPIRFDPDQSRRRFGMNVLMHDFHSTPGEVLSYTESGHRTLHSWSNRMSSPNTCLTAGEAVSIVIQGLTSPTFWDENRQL